MKQKAIRVIAVVLTLLISGCAAKSPDKIELGDIQNGIYHNKFFGLAVHLPAEWKPLSQASMKRTMDLGKTLVAGKNETLKAEIDVSAQQTVSLFSVSQYELGAPVPFNPNLACFAEKIDQMPGIQHGADYLFHVKKSFQAGALPYALTQDITKEQIDGKPFAFVKVDLRMPRTTVHQIYRATVMKGYAIGFVSTYATDEEAKTIDDTIQSMTFDK